MNFNRGADLALFTRQIVPGPSLEFVEGEVEMIGPDGQLAGRAETVSPVTAATISREPERGPCSNSRKVAQAVPIKITLQHHSG